MQKKRNINAFIALMRAGLWEKEVELLQFGKIDFNAICKLSEEQAVTGLVAAGLEHVKDLKVPKEVSLELATYVLHLEQRNVAMNYFIGTTVEMMSASGIKALLVKGQGIAQCYERPLWRSSGDIDLLFDEENYQMAKSYLSPLAQSIEEEITPNLHLAMTCAPWVIELHGTLRSGLGKRIDRIIDEVQRMTFENNQMRVWKNGKTKVLLPAPNNDVLFVFCHILQHFFIGGIGLRQLCDWCRILWTYRNEIDYSLLESRLRRMGLMSEWMAFASVAVNLLGMPQEAMPFYSPSHSWGRKSKRIISHIIETGNFGHNRDSSYINKYPYLIYKSISLMRNTWDSFRHLFVFPMDSILIWWRMIMGGFSAVFKGK